MRWRNQKKTAGEILPLLSPGKVLCVFDTETTGLPRAGKTVKIIQFSAIRLRVLDGYSFEEIDFFDTYINPHEPLSEKVSELTGITDGMLEQAGDEQLIGPQIFRYMYNADAWCAYNARFDLGMLYGMAERLGVYFERMPCLDVLDFARDWLEKGTDVPDYSLRSVHDHLFPDGDVRFHCSLDDVRATVSVMSVFVQEYLGCKDAPEGGLANAKVLRAYAWINPHNPRQQRIRTVLENTGKDGDIFYDCIDKCWSCASTSKAKKLFQTLDMAEIERQTLAICSNSYVRYHDMDQLSKDRIGYLRKKMKGKKDEKAS